MFFFFSFCEFVRLLYESLHISEKWQRITPLPYMLCEESALFSLVCHLITFIITHRDYLKATEAFHFLHATCDSADIYCVVIYITSFSDQKVLIHFFAL